MTLDEKGHGQHDSSGGDDLAQDDGVNSGAFLNRHVERCRDISLRFMHAGVHEEIDGLCLRALFGICTSIKLVNYAGRQPRKLRHAAEALSRSRTGFTRFWRLSAGWFPEMETAHRTTLALSAIAERNLKKTADIG